MESSNIKLARKIINKYPEVFESLLEFERTKRIPKLYRRKKLTVTIDENTLRRFKNYSERNNVGISRFIEKEMLKEMNKE